MPSRETRESLLGRTLRDGAYRIERVLGHGGMGKVYLAMHTSLKVPFALKQARADQPLPESVIMELNHRLHGNDMNQRTSHYHTWENDFPASGGIHTDRFLREALLLIRLQHPAIPMLYDYFFEDGYWYLVMDYIPGPTLGTYLRMHAPLSPLEALNYTMQICDVLDYLHKQSPPIIFRDLKPSNIILTPEGVLMLVDFGIARYFKTGQVNDTTDFGSPGYASPEQYQGEGQTDGRSDLFSLGVILHEMLSGKRLPATGGSVPSSQILSLTISPILRGLIALATRTEPMYRFQSAHAFYLALERAYSIEEQRAYQRHIHKVKEMEQAPGESKRQSQEAREDIAAKASPDMPIIPRLSLSLQQRQQLRESLQQEQQVGSDQGKQPAVLVHKDLKHHTSSHAYSETLPAIEAEPRSITPPVPAPKKSSVGQTWLLIALIMLLFAASAFAYTRFLSHPAAHTHNAHQQITMTTETTMMPKQKQDNKQNAWQQLSSLPSAEADNSAIYVQEQGQDYIYTSGGFRGSKHFPYYDHNLYRYDIVDAHWESVTNAQFPGMLNNAATVDEQGHIFFTTGYSTDTYMVASLLYMYQPGTGNLQKILPPPQMPTGFGTAMLADQQGHLYITQGYMKGGNAQESAGTGWYRYDIATGAWHALAPLPRSLGYVILARTDNGNILLQGGATDAGQHNQSNKIYAYNVSQNSWTEEQATMPQQLSGAASCSIRPGQMVVIGGYDATHNTGLNTVWLVDLHTLRWNPLASLPVGDSVLGAAACDGRGHVYLVRGASDPSHPTADFWQLTVN